MTEPEQHNDPSDRFARQLRELETAGNLRRIPPDVDPARCVDLTSNDYLGLAADADLAARFRSEYPDAPMTSSASRLLALHQDAYTRLEGRLEDVYGPDRRTLLFNSGYHANTGIIQAVADRRTLIVADRLVHASIIDGIRLSGATFVRFRHNDTAHLQQILQAKAADYETVLIIAESVYSMDGDSAPLREIADIKRHTPGALLYVDEAHGVGVCGHGGLGLSAAEGTLADTDIMVGTFGKALASYGAFAVVSPVMHSYLVNRARSLIFSTAIPPACALWSLMTLEESLSASWRRDDLARNARLLADIIPGGAPSHIRPFITGSSARAVELSARLDRYGFKVLPIRTPTVPAGTERLRFSLSAAIAPSQLARLAEFKDLFTRP